MKYFKGARFKAICGDGIVRSIQVTASQPWCWDAISACTQVSKNGERVTISGNLSCKGLADQYLYRHPAPQGVEHRFHSQDLEFICGCTPHRPIAPALRKLASRTLGRFANIPSLLVVFYFASDLRAVAANRGLCSPDSDEIPDGREWGKAVRFALSRIKDRPLLAYARLAWALRCYKLGGANWEKKRI